MPNTDNNDNLPDLSRRFHQGLATLHPLSEQDLQKIKAAVEVEHSNAQPNRAIEANETAARNSEKSGSVEFRLKKAQPRAAAERLRERPTLKETKRKVPPAPKKGRDYVGNLKMPNPSDSENIIPIVELGKKSKE